MVAVVVGIEIIAVGQENFSTVECDPLMVGDTVPQFLEARAQSEFVVAGEKGQFYVPVPELFESFENWFIDRENGFLVAVPEIKKIAEDEEAFKVIWQVVEKDEQVPKAGSFGVAEMGVSQKNRFHDPQVIMETDCLVKPDEWCCPSIAGPGSRETHGAARVASVTRGSAEPLY